MYQKILKRIFDIVIALPLLILLIPFFIVISLMIKIEDHGPVFYNALRLGKNGVIFKMFKFRTMKVNAPDIRNEDGSTFNSELDPRLTRIGKLLRKSSLDEIPQLINVLIGNMSLVGPRPDLPEHYDLYTPLEKKKLLVLPGITGYNQALFRNSIPWKQRLQKDIYYVQNISFNFDIKIIIKTFSNVIMKKNVFGG